MGGGRTASGADPGWKAIGEFIRAQRQLAQLSLRQLAGLAEVSNPYLSQIERGLHQPSLQVLRGIARALDLSADTLYARAGLLDDGERRPGVGVEAAVRLDSRLSAQQKRTLIDIYRGFTSPPEPGPRTDAPRPVRAAKPAQPRAARAPTQGARS